MLHALEDEYFYYKIKGFIWLKAPETDQAVQDIKWTWQYALSTLTMTNE